MKKTIIALATVSSMAFAVPAFSQSAMGQGADMLTGALFNYFTLNELPTDGIMDLSLGQIAQIKGIIDGDESVGDKKNRVMAIVEN